MSLSFENEKGTVTISQSSIANIAGIVTTGCYGVVGMGYKNAADGIVGILRGDTITKGISVSSREEGITLDLHIVVEYGVNINAVTHSIIQNVKYSVEKYTGINVMKINVFVDDIRLQ